MSYKAVIFQLSLDIHVDYRLFKLGLAINVSNIIRS